MKEMQPPATYIVCTVVHNEAETIASVIADVAAQTHKPAFWLIVDDQSDDATVQVIRGMAEKYDWLACMSYARDRHLHPLMHLSKLKAFASQEAMRQAEQRGIDFGYIGLLDADMRIDVDFYHALLEEMAMDPALGLASARIITVHKDGTRTHERARDDLPGCATLFCRRECFNALGGVPACAYPEDAIMIARAQIAGWKTKRCQAIAAYHLRKTSTRYGLRTAFFLHGQRVFFLCHSPLYVCARALSIMCTDGIGAAFHFVRGYAAGHMRGQERLSDKRLIAYFRREREKQLIAQSLRPAKKVAKDT